MSRLETELITRIEELQSELNEQCRLLGMSAERELALLAEIERLRAEIEAMRVQKPVAGMCPDDLPKSRDGFDTLPDDYETGDY